jgi:hypothetical protein
MDKVKQAPPLAPVKLVEQFIHDVNKLYKNNELDKIIFISGDKLARERIQKYYLEDVSDNFVLHKITQ